MKVVVIGASLDPTRASHRAVHLLRALEHETVAVGRSTEFIGGLQLLTGQPQIEKVDTVTLYINPKVQEEFYDYIISLSPRRVIFNPGTENDILYRKLEEANIDYEAACTLVLLRTGQF